MPVVPIVEKNVPIRPIGTPGQLARVPNPYIREEGIGGALQEASATLTKNQELQNAEMRKLAEAAKKRADDAKANENQAIIDTWETNNVYDPVNGALAQKGKNAFDLHNTNQTKFKKDMEKVRAGLANEEQRIEFDRKANSANARMAQTINAHQRQEMNAYRTETYAASQVTTLNRASRVAASPDLFEQTVNEAKVNAVKFHQSEGDDPAVISSKIEKVDELARTDALKYLADTNPAAAIEFYNKNINRFGSQLIEANKLIVPVERKYKATELAQQALAVNVPVQSKEGAVNFVMQSLEGGDVLVADGDSVARGGTNQKYNPEINVTTAPYQNLVAHNTKKYWDAAGVNELPPAIQIVAFDAFMQHGVDDGTRKMIADANGDPIKLIQIRTEYYNELAKDPKNAGNVKGWQRRMSDLTLQVEAQGQELPNQFTVNQRIDAGTDDLEVAADAKTLSNALLDSAMKARKQGWDDAEEEYFTRKNAGLPSLPSVEKRMEQKRLAEIRKGGDAFDPAVYEMARNMVLVGKPIDLKDIRPQLGDEYKNLVDIQQDPDKRAFAKVTEDVAKRAGLLKFGAEPSQMSATEYRKRDELRRRLEDEIRIAERRSGKKLGPEEAQKIADRMVIDGTVVTGKTGIFGRPVKEEKTSYQLLPQEEKNFYAEPPDEVTTEAVSLWMRRQRGTGAINLDFYDQYGDPTDDGIIRIYTRLRQRGLTDRQIQGGF